MAKNIKNKINKAFNWDLFTWSLFISYGLIQISIISYGSYIRKTESLINFPVFIIGFLTTLGISAFIFSIFKNEIKPKFNPSKRFLVLVSTICLLPMFFSNVSTISFMTPKFFFLYAITILLIYYSTEKNIRIKNLTSHLNIKIILLFLLVLLAGSFKNFGSNSLFTGNLINGAGTIINFSVFFILFIITKEEVTEEKAQILLTYFMASSFLPIFYGFIQFKNWDILGIFQNPGGKAQIFSTLGNVNWLASYLVLISLTSAYVFLKSKTLKTSFISYGFINFTILLIILTRSRGAWVSMSFAYFSLVIFLSYSLLKNKKKLWNELYSVTKFLIKLQIPVIIALLIIYSTISPLNNQINIIKRIKDSFKNEFNVQQRLHVWTISLEMFNNNKLLGNGTGSFGRDYLEYQRKYFTRKNDRSILQYGGNARESHNEYIQILAENGIIGFLLFMMILFYPVYIFFRNFKNENNNILLICLISAYCGLMIHSLVSFPLQTPVSAAIFFIFGGLISGFNKDYSREEISFKPNNIFIMFLILPFFIISLISNIISDSLTSMGQEHLKYQRIPQAEKKFINALNFNPFRGDTHYLLGTAKLSLQKFDEAKKHLEYALNFVNDKGILNNLGFLYQRKEDFKNAEICFRKAYLYEPRNCETANNVAMISLKQNKIAEGIDYLNRAVTQNPYYITSLNNLGDLYLKQKNFKKAEEYYTATTSQNPRECAVENFKRKVYSFTSQANIYNEYSRAYYGLAQIYSKLENSIKSEKFFLEALKFNKNNSMILFRLGLFYLKYGERDKSIIYLKKAALSSSQFGKMARNKLRNIGAK